MSWNEGIVFPDSRPEYDLAVGMIGVVYDRIMAPQEVTPGFFIERSVPLTYRDLLIELVREGACFSRVSTAELVDEKDNVHVLPLEQCFIPRQSGLRLAADEGEVVSDPAGPIIDVLCIVFKDTASFIKTGTIADAALGIPSSYQVAAEAFLAGMGRSQLVNAVLQEAMK